MCPGCVAAASSDVAAGTVTIALYSLATGACTRTTTCVMPPLPHVSARGHACLARAWG